MDKLLIVYAHLIATCMAIGVIVTTDLRLLGQLKKPMCVIRPPRAFETRVMSFALFLLCASGAWLVAMDLHAGPTAAGSLDNPKLQAKLLLVGMLCLNAFALHFITFPFLTRQVPVSMWSMKHRLSVALPVGLSNSLWLYCAFLGIARSWNHTRSLEDTLLPAAAVFAVMTGSILIFLQLAGRGRPVTAQNLVGSMKDGIGRAAPIGSYAGMPAFEDTDALVN